MALPQPKPSPAAPAPRRALIHTTGALLFLFIPVVLFLYVQHPEPVGLSLAAGVLLMLGHRFLARPFMDKVLPVRCVWCGRVLPPAAEAEPRGETASLGLRKGERTLAARCCARHKTPAAKFFSFLYAWRWPLRLGIFVPLLFLLVALAAQAAGQPSPVSLATTWFKLIVGVTVNLAAFGYLAARPEREPVHVPFPVHNFFLLGVRALLWIFRLVGIWWIWQGLSSVLG